MLKTETWWESIFTGERALGLNETKIHELENEDFLFFSSIQEANHSSEGYEAKQLE